MVEVLASETEPDARSRAIEAVHAATAIYTAEPVVDQLLDLLQWPEGQQTLVDPSCGNGMFLVRALERLLDAEPMATEATFRRLEGWEFHPAACHEARSRIQDRLVLAGRPLDVARQIAADMVHCADFLAEGPDEARWDLCAGNPPYLRRLRVPSMLRDEYDAVVPDYANADLLHAFLDRCVRCLRPGGRIGFVTADRWLASTQGAALRSTMGRQVAIAGLTRLDAKSAFFQAKTRRVGTPPRVHPVAVVLSNREEAGLQPLTAEPIYPGSDPDRYRGLQVLGARAKVRLAPWLGTDGVFLVDAEVAATLPQDHLVPVLAPQDLAGGQLRPVNRWAVRTYPGQPPAGAVRFHLERNHQKMSVRGRQAGPWSPPESFHAWDLSRPMLVVPRILSKVEPVWVPPGRLPISHQLAIQCDSADELELVGVALRQPKATEWLREHAPRLENGYHQLSAPLLRRMPLDGIFRNDLLGSPPQSAMALCGS